MAELTDIVNRPHQKGGSIGNKEEKLPILQEESLEYHVNKIVENNADVREALKEKPYLRDALTKYVQQTMDEYKWLLYGAKTFDTADKFSNKIPDLTDKLLIKAAEMPFKAAYLTYYAVKSGDYLAPAYFEIILEPASLVPGIGPKLVHDIYTNRVRSQMQKRAAEKFLENIVNKPLPSEIPPRQKPVFH